MANVFPYSQLESYNIYKDRGLLPSPNPSQSLPHYYHIWDDLARAIPKILIGGYQHVRKVLGGMPILETENLASLMDLERAMVVLSYLAHAYVWCDADGSGNSASSCNSLPACIALPWYKVSRKLGRLPALQHATIIQNWRLLDEDKPIELGNIVMQHTFYGGIDEEWFFLIPIAIEAKGGIIIDSIVQAQRAVDKGLVGEVTNHLQELSIHLKEITHILKRMREWCHPTVFYVRVRPFLHGFSNLPNGLIFEGVEELHDIPQKFAGGSAGQSSLIQVIDAALEVKHSESFLVHMREYMQPLHAKFLQEVEAKATIRQFVLLNRNSADLVKYYDECLKDLVEFRNYHIQLASSYILAQARDNNHASRGTGGSHFMTMLKTIRDTTITTSVDYTPADIQLDASGVTA